MTDAAHVESVRSDAIGAPLGPGSLTWKFFGDHRAKLFLGRSGTLQNMHPAVGAALQQHSNFFDDPWDRLLRSLPKIEDSVYDPPESGAAARVRDYHRDIKGVDHHGVGAQCLDGGAPATALRQARVRPHRRGRAILSHDREVRRGREFRQDAASPAAVISRRTVAVISEAVRIMATMKSMS
ncbi:oxygenase MpaB family protein [Nocardia huaxiensis]|uniref:oxygenase MpaB family protein n=1 Tax=Nocardia huaxiensis TaxID=2755382 RepID=UPI001E2D0714|nr:oxygenase MpaB family protein [Nocardia huaxiensis]UFS95820.1 oxygenase MpaB family protein [Nocardia huaxiensis]